MRVLIVGAGLAGCTLAHHFLKRGAKVQLLHNGENVSSAIAAGIINPMVFRRTTLSWRLDELLPFANAYYRELEELFDLSFFHEIPIRRFFAHEQERTTWLKKQELSEYKSYLSTLSEKDLNFESSNNTFGTGVVKQSSMILSKKFMEANWSYFKRLDVLEVHSFNYDLLNPETGTYRDETYDFVLFSEGKDGVKNPWFGYLPLTQTKGELLTLQIENINQTESLNRKCFLMPQKDGTFKAGSTYVFHTDDCTPTEEGKAQILNNLLSITSEKPTVIGHEAGVRPTVLDRRPLLGKHPHFQKLVIANGLGTKGYMIGPLLMQELVEHLLDGKELDKESNITRFESLI